VLTQQPERPATQLRPVWRDVLVEPRIEPVGGVAPDVDDDVGCGVLGQRPLGHGLAGAEAARDDGRAAEGERDEGEREPHVEHPLPGEERPVVPEIDHDHPGDHRRRDPRRPAAADQ